MTIRPAGSSIPTPLVEVGIVSVLVVGSKEMEGSLVRVEIVVSKVTAEDPDPIEDRIEVCSVFGTMREVTEVEAISVSVAQSISQSRKPVIKVASLYP